MRISTRQAARRLLARLLDGYGYELKEKTKPLRRCDQFLYYVRSKGFRPKTIIDIGVGHGTQWLYTPFPEAYLILIEANSAFADSIEAILSQRRGEYHRTAVGSHPGSETMKINSIHPTSSSMLLFHDDYQKQLIQYGILAQKHDISVPVTTLDSLIMGDPMPPILMKLDIEGYEIEALKGGRDLLRQIEIVIVELSVAERFQGAPSFGESLAFMEACGFAIYDVVDLGQLGADGPLVSMDVAFLRKGSPLRSCT